MRASNHQDISVDRHPHLPTMCPFLAPQQHALTTWLQKPLCRERLNARTIAGCPFLLLPLTNKLHGPVFIKRITSSINPPISKAKHQEQDHGLHIFQDMTLSMSQANRIVGLRDGFPSQSHTSCALVTSILFRSGDIYISQSLPQLISPRNLVWRSLKTTVT